MAIGTKVNMRGVKQSGPIPPGPQIDFNTQVTNKPTLDGVIITGNLSHEELNLVDSRNNIEDVEIIELFN